MNILITIDYELFGNGTGDVCTHMIEPANRLMTLGEKYNIPVTFFVEIEEYLAFERYSSELTKKLGYDPAEMVRKQVGDIVRRGHDVQLHIHPQWKDAHFENGSWILNRDVNNIDSLFNDIQDTVDYIKTRKNALEKLFETVDPKRKLCAFRAGAFCAQPGKLLIPALYQNGIKYESSVVKGLHRTYGQGKIDFRFVPDSTFWRVMDDVAVKNSEGLITEIPIGSKMQWRFQQLSYNRIKAKFSGNVPKEKQQETLREIGVSKNPLSILRFLLKKAPTKFDIHNVEAKKLLRLLKTYYKKEEGTRTVVLIGHTKEHISDTNVDNFFRLLKNNQDLRPVTFNTLIL